MASLHISINAEPIFYIGQIAVTNSMLTSVVVSFIIILLALIINRSIDPNARRPKGLQNVAEAFIDSLYNLVHTTTHNARATAIIFPLITTAFIYILLNNWYGLMPWVSVVGITEEPHRVMIGAKPAYAATQTENMNAEVDEVPNAYVASEGEETHASAATEAESTHGKTFIPIFRPATADLNATLALALISVGATQIIGLKFLGIGYLSKFFNLKGIYSFVGILELVSEISKIISFAFRLFGNIFAGEVLLTVIYSLIPLLIPIPFVGLEFFVGLIQALVFAMLTVVFMSLATHGHEEH